MSLDTLISTRSGLFSEDGQISVRVLISKTLATVPSTLPDPECLQTVVRALNLELSLVTTRVEAYISGLPLLPSSRPSDNLSFEHIEYCLRILYSFLLGQWTDDGKSLEMHSLGEGLVSLAVTTGIMVDNSLYGDNQRIGMPFFCLFT
jgi:hypothetical protein